MAIAFQARTELSQEEIAAWNARGYHIHEQLFSEEEVDALRAACEAVARGEYETGQAPDDLAWAKSGDPLAVLKIDNAWKASNTIKQFVTSARLGHIAAQLLNASSIRLWHDQYLFKPPQGGKVLTWHQDWAYWQMIAECETCTCWIALGDVLSEAQGPMVYLEGSHKLGLYELPETITGDDEQKPMLPEDSEMREVPVLVRAGQVAFHHGLTLHGSGKNLSQHPRKAIVSHVMSGQCTYRPGQPHMNERLMKTQPECPQPGERFRGPQFPLMWSV